MAAMSLWGGGKKVNIRRPNKKADICSWIRERGAGKGNISSHASGCPAPGRIKKRNGSVDITLPPAPFTLTR